MRNGLYDGTVKPLIEGIRDRLPPRWRAVLRQRPAGGRVSGYDAHLEVASPDGTKGVFAVEARRRIDPRDVPSVVGGAKRASDGRPVLVLTQFLSKRTRDVLKQEGASYADATGNLRIALDRPGLFLEAQGSDKDPGSEPRPLRSLRGAAAGRIVRALCDIDPPYGVRELALKASTPLGSVGRVVGLLDREALVERDERGRIEKARRSDLVRRWVQDYGLQRSNDAVSCLAPRGIPSMLDRLKGLTDYSLTGSLAASRRRTVAPARLAMVYTREPGELAEALGVRETDAGANVLLLRPYDPVVFERTWSEDGLVFAALSQVAADLLTSPGRGPSEGEELLRWMQENVRGWEA